jgi:hypothetical protein
MLIAICLVLAIGSGGCGAALVLGCALPLVPLYALSKWSVKQMLEPPRQQHYEDEYYEDEYYEDEYYYD